MSVIVLDANMVLTWVGPTAEQGHAEAPSCAVVTTDEQMLDVAGPLATSSVP